MEAKERLKPYGPRTVFVHGSYQDLSLHLIKAEFPETLDGILLDLGANSFQFDDAQRGFSIMHNGPLDMRFDQSDFSLKTAAEIVNETSEVELTKIFQLYGQEPFAKEAAKAIVRRRSRGMEPFETTADLRNCLENVLSRWKSKKKIHPATLCFQAIRIAVNRELEHVEVGLATSLKTLAPSGRLGKQQSFVFFNFINYSSLAVISFHSLEDKLVKTYFREKANTDEYSLMPKRAIKGTAEEILLNPRARSARLRCIERNPEK